MAVDEVVEDVAHDGAAALVREHEHLDHPVARRVGEVFFDQFQRRLRCRVRVRARESARRPPASAVDRLRRGSTPPGSTTVRRRSTLTCRAARRATHAAPRAAGAAAPAEVRARDQRDRERRARARRTANRSARRPRAARTHRRTTLPDTNAPGPTPTPACCNHVAAPSCRRSRRERGPRRRNAGAARPSASRPAANSRRRPRAPPTTFTRDSSGRSSSWRSEDTGRQRTVDSRSSPGGSAPVHSNGRPSAARTKIGSNVWSSPSARHDRRDLGDLPAHALPHRARRRDRRARRGRGPARRPRARCAR